MSLSRLRYNFKLTKVKFCVQIHKNEISVKPNYMYTWKNNDESVVKIQLSHDATSDLFARLRIKHWLDAMFVYLRGLQCMEVCVTCANKMRSSNGRERP